MNSLPWFKVYTDILDEPKLATLSEVQRWRFMQLLALAGECGAGGYLVSSGIPLPLEEMAWRLRVDATQLKEDLRALQRTRLLEFEQESQAWLVPSFARRQGLPGEGKREQWKEQKRRQRQRQAQASSLDEINAIDTIAADNTSEAGNTSAAGNTSEAGNTFARENSLALTEDEDEEEIAAGDPSAAGSGLGRSNLFGEQAELEDDVLEDIETGPDGHVRLKSRIEEDWTRPRWTKEESREEGEERQTADTWQRRVTEDNWRPRDRSGPPTTLGEELKNFQRRLGKGG